MGQHCQPSFTKRLAGLGVCDVECCDFHEKTTASDRVGSFASQPERVGVHNIVVDRDHHVGSLDRSTGSNPTSSPVRRPPHECQGSGWCGSLANDGDGVGCRMAAIRRARPNPSAAGPTLPGCNAPNLRRTGWHHSRPEADWRDDAKLRYAAAAAPH